MTDEQKARAELLRLMVALQDGGPVTVSKVMEAHRVVVDAAVTAERLRLADVLLDWAVAAMAEMADERLASRLSMLAKAMRNGTGGFGGTNGR